MPTMQPSTNYVVGEIADVQLANGQTAKAVIPTVNVQAATGVDPIPVAQVLPATGTVTSVPSAVADTLILAANANRKGATITNTDENALKLLLSTGVASAANHTASLAAGGYYEVPFGYTGQIRGIWTADGTGAALVTTFA